MIHPIPETMKSPRLTPEERFWKKVEQRQNNECWLWLGCKSTTGYGHAYWKGSWHNAHRISFLIANGSVREGSHIDHLCRNPSCVNPCHLEEVTPRVNWERGTSPWRKRALQTHCLRGHEFTYENTYYHKSRGVRICRTCHRDFEREKWRKTHASYSRNHEITER